MRRSPYFPALVVLALALVAGILAPRFQRHARSAEEAALALQREGHAGSAETVYWEAVRANPTVPNVIAFLDAHSLARDVARVLRRKGHENDDPEETRGQLKSPSPAETGSTVTESEIDAFLARSDLPKDVTLLGRYWRDLHEGEVGDELRAGVREAAAATPPMPWANRLLAEEAERAGDIEKAATLLLREAHFMPNDRHDVDYAFALLLNAKDWDAITTALDDPTIEPMVGLGQKARWAIETNHYRRAIPWIFKLTYSRPAAGPLALTAIAALAWWLFVAQLGKTRERPFFRVLLYVAAFALGTLSIPLTDFLILVEESKLHLVESGDIARDLIYYVFGVGLREELSKLLLFLPLVPILRSPRFKAQPVDVLVCGACVGLGFAAMENINYLSSSDLGTGMGRFLTANFLHMAMTAVIASAAFEFANQGDDYAPAFSMTALQVIAMHGAYDFFIVHPNIGGGYLSMTVFFFLVNRFLAAVDMARGRSERRNSLLRTFMLGTATVAGASFVWASYLVGPAVAGRVLAPGLLGVAIIIYVFARRFERM